MKPLNRPMFKNGGPIKEGIMSGMKEPQAINTVGSPLAPQDSSGRQGYAIPILGALIAGARALPTVYRGIRAAGAARTPGTAGFFRNLFPTGRFRTVPGKQQSPSPEFIKGDPTAFAGGPGPDKVLGLKEAIKNPFLLGKAIRENPITAFTAASAVPQTAFLAGKGAVAGVKSVPDLLKGYVEAVLPGKQFDDKEKTTEEDSTGLKKVDKFEETEPKNEVVSQEKKDQLIKDNIEENRKRYYKLMGIDKMKKGAAYDSLIDASRIIQEEGGDLKGSIKSGNLQTRIIDAISKNLDKSSDIKRQIDAAILQGEIKKDIASADTMDKRLKEAQIERLERDAKENSTAAKITRQQLDKGAITGGETAAILREDGIDYKGVLPDDELLKFKNKNKAADERDFLIQNYPTLDDGRYVVGGRLVEKRGDQVAFVI
jgi:hypothetical protein